MSLLSRLNKEQSIATRLFISAAAWSTILLLIAGIFLVTLYRRNTEKSFDDRLSVYLRALVADMAVGNEEQRNEPGQLGDPQFDLAQSGWYWQVARLDSSETPLRQSLSLSGATLPRLSDPDSESTPGSVNASYVQGPDGRRLRLFERIIDIGASGTYLIQVAASTEDAEDQIWRFKLTLIATFTMLSLALVGTTALQVRFGLQPLRRLQGEVASIRKGEGERIEGDFPQDLAPLADELNLLISSNREVVERARTQVGNLAHALKTPLSVIVNEADREDSDFAKKIREQTTIMSDQVTYYLDRARAAARARVAGSVVDVDASLDALLRTFEKIYFERRLDFELNSASELRFRGEKQDFEEMAGNLLDNAGKWAKSHVLVEAQRINAAAGIPDLVEITIDDDGPGLPPSQRAEALARGKRLDETKPGSGLGLNIVLDLASVYGGTLSLEDSPLGGLRARLRLPAV
jgi:signal transduction histidine kinase